MRKRNKIITLILIAVTLAIIAMFIFDKLKTPTHNIGSLFEDLFIGIGVFIATLITGGIYLYKNK
jgi:uncharacterized membrane protein (DUF485 family)